ncbi:MAG: lipopolysaccharide biosynthesis protein [Aquabacterium sp.]
MRDQAIRARIWAALGAGAFSQVISLVIQLGSLPLFLMQWDPSRYGVWLMLSAIPAYLSMADVGLVTTAGNRMTMALARQQVAAADRIFQTAQLFMVLVISAILALAGSVIFGGWIQMPHEQAWALWWLTVAVLLSLAGGLAEAVFRSTHRYAQGTTWANLIRLLEWVASLLGLYLTDSFVGVAMGMAMARLLGLLVLVWRCDASQHQLSWGLNQASSQELREMIKPAVSFMAFPLANALTFQGATLLVGWILGPASVTAFNAARTVSRVAVQCTAIPAHALWAEFSRLSAHTDVSALHQLYRRGWRSGLVLSVVLSAALYFVGPWLYQWWTAKQLSFDADLMLILLIYAAVAGVWHVPRVLLMSTNQHSGLAVWQLVSSGLMLLIGWWGITHGGLVAMAWSMLLMEVWLAGICVMQVRSRFHQGPVNGVVLP